VPETGSAATDLDLISFLKAIPDARMRRGVRIPAWYLCQPTGKTGPALCIIKCYLQLVSEVVQFSMSVDSGDSRILHLTSFAMSIALALLN